MTFKKMRLGFGLAALGLTLICGAQGVKHRVVVEVNMPGSIAYNAVLGNVENLIKAFAPEPVEVEIVCLGEGIDMLLGANEKLSKRILKDQGLGVKFAACGNTIIGKHIDKAILPNGVVVVPSGVAEVVLKEEAGFSYLKGGY